MALREERQLNRAHIDDLEKKMMQTKQTLSSREMALREMSEREQQMSDRLNDATDEVERLRSEGSGAALYKAEVEVQDLREEKERLAIDFEKAKKVGFSSILCFDICIPVCQTSLEFMKMS